MSARAPSPIATISATRAEPRPGDVQVMHAGTGIVHAEYNRETVPTRLFQIWIQPDRHGVAPGWGTRAISQGKAALRCWRAAGRRTPAAGALPLHADAALLAGTLRAGEKATVRARSWPRGLPGRRNGAVTVNGTPVGTRDGAAITGESEFAVVATENAELVMVDVAD